MGATHLHRVRQSFERICRQRLGDNLAREDMERLFPSTMAAEAPPATAGDVSRAYYEDVGRYFDDDAEQFAERYRINRTLSRMRDRFREVTAPHTFNTALEIGCGPGIDLAYWAGRRPQAQIYGIDVSNNMVRLAESRLAQAGATNAHCAVGSVEDVDQLFPGKRFDMVYVYFGALNTVTDLRAAARCIRSCMSSDGVAVLTFVNRWFVLETVWYLLSFRWKRAFARWRPVWGGYAAHRSLPSRCYSPGQIRTAFAPELRVQHREGFSILHPAWHRDRWVRRFPRLCDGLWRVDRILCRTPLWCLGEYALYVLVPEENVGDGRFRTSVAKGAAGQERTVP
jgi:ubiquinone/menaquinone biosynthesis C-methylase UbiE